jgi:hypothetical protein
MALALLAAPAWAAGLAPARIAEMRSLQQAAFHSDYAYRQVEALSDGIGPRLSGSPGAAAAVDYVAGEMRRLGLDVHLEPCMVPHWVRGAETGELVGWPGKVVPSPQKIVLTALGRSVATPPQGITAEVVVVHSFDDLKAHGDVHGKIVLFDYPFNEALAAQGFGLDAYEDAVPYRVDGASAAVRQGAVAALVRSVGPAGQRLPHTGVMSYEKDVAKIPTAAVTAEDADLMARLAAQGPIRMHLVLTPQTLPDVPSFNVIGDLKGRDRAGEVVLVSGHLDSWDLGTGAIDDGAGVACAMEVAHLIQAQHLTPSRTIRVVAWMNEENGSQGAKAYRTDYKDTRHYAAIEMDLGADRPAGFAAHVSPSGLAALEDIRKVLAEGGAPTLVPSFEEGGADVWGLGQDGVATFGVLNDSRNYFRYHHTPADTLDKIDPPQLRANAAAMTVLTWGLAHLDAALR